VRIPDDNLGLIVRCIAENQRIDHEVTSNTFVKIHYPPNGVTVEGSSRVAQGEMVSLRCKSGPAFPVPSLQWKIRRNGEEQVLETDELNYQGEAKYKHGGASMISELSFSAGPPGKLEVECFAEHETLGENKKAFIHVVDILEKSLEKADSEAGTAKRGETTKKKETSDEHKSNRDMNEPKEGEVKSASTSQGGRVDQSLMLPLILNLLPLCSTLLLEVQTF